MRTVYAYLWYLLIYACLGWCAEVAYAAVKTGKFVNRGFLSGPVCPIYGFGVCLVVFCLTPVQNRLWLLFLGAVVLTSAIELATGFVLEKVYHEHWWDYSERPLNFRGYICLEFSLLWGLACVLVLRLVHPLIAHLVGWLPLGLGIALLAALLSALIIDLASTVVDLHRFRKAIGMVQGIAARLQRLSDGMGESISSATLSAMRRTEEVQAEADAYLSAKRSQHLQDKADMMLELHSLLSRAEASSRRLFRAFPNLTNGDSKKRMEEIKDLLRQHMEANR